MGVASDRPGPLRWSTTLLGAVVILIGAGAADLSTGVRVLVVVGGLAIILLAPALVRATITSVRLTETEVSGPGFLGSVTIPWRDVILVRDDEHAVTVQSGTRSVRIELSTVTVRSTIGGATLGNFRDPEAIVAYVLAHVPKSAMMEMRHWLPT